MENRKGAPTGKSIRILHVDDDLALLEAAKQVIHDINSVFTIDFALNVDEAFSKLATDHYDVIISDYELPAKNGLDFLKTLRQTGRQIPFILFTGKGREEVAMQALNLGADGYYNKQGTPETVYGELVHGILTVYEKWRTKQALEESERRFQDLIETTGEFIWEMDPQGRYTYCSPQMEQLWGIKPESMIGKTPFDVMPVEYREMALQGFLSFGLSPTPFRNLESFAYDSQGRPIVIEINGMPFFDGAGKLLGFRGITRDITERKRNEEQQKNNYKKVQKANEKLQVVGSLTRHDVINKLSTINAQAYLVKKKFADNPQIAKAMDTIKLAVEQSNKLFEFSKLYERIGSEELVSLDVEETFNGAKNLLAASQVKFTCSCQGLKVHADSMLLQVFYNLIDNSLKHGTKVTEITLDCSTNQTEDKLVYSDNGDGVPENSKEKIFAKTFSADGKSGHGLYLVRKIVEEYGWTIKETGTPGAGARFEVTIPKVKPQVAMPKVTSVDALQNQQQSPC